MPLAELLATLHSINQQKKAAGAPCNQCFEADCVCRPRCGECAGPREGCVCLYGGGCGRCVETCTCSLPTQCPCDACASCASRVSDNRRGVSDFIDSTLVAHTIQPGSRLMMLDMIDSMLQAIDGRKNLRVEQVRVSIARRMFGRMMARVCDKLQRINGLRCENEDDWSEIYLLLHDIRDVFVHTRAPATLVHREFGRLCVLVSSALKIHRPEAWLAIDDRPHAIRCLRQSVGRALAAADVSFLGDWGQRQLAVVVAVMV